MKHLCNHTSRLFSNAVGVVPKLLPVLAEKLTNRELIRIQGDEALPFLQGLITNDMFHLANGNESMFTMFLNKSGRVLYDSLIYSTSTAHKNAYIIECDKRIGAELRRHLRMFRVRKKIDIDSISNDYCPWVIINSHGASFDLNFSTEDASHGIFSTLDPRLKALGYRLILPKEYCFDKLKLLLATELTEHLNLTNETNDYTTLRYRCGVGEGIDDHPPTKCFPLEANCDYLHGVSFHKGCYIGQELTARVHHTGVIRKRLMPLVLTENIEKHIDQVQLQNGSIIGTIRNSKNKSGLALIRTDKLKGSASSLMVDSLPASVFIPDWWPHELSSQLLANAE